ncbi:hypothetical protein [Thermococcus sp. 2319x1]|uniref:hypothetical protein n=1 Tax=Thermococcus sp. 2319x1 TaxID=1674923 RepID=UPI0015825716|nr:hypothetical protein [Thermococcus sp. 2319x1]
MTNIKVTKLYIKENIKIQNCPKKCSDVKKSGGYDNKWTKFSAKNHKGKGKKR